VDDPDLRCTSADYGAINFKESATATAGTLTHEFGHIAALAHPTVLEYSIMHQSGHPYRVQYVTSYDESELENKYD